MFDLFCQSIKNLSFSLINWTVLSPSILCFKKAWSGLGIFVSRNYKCSMAPCFPLLLNIDPTHFRFRLNSFDWYGEVSLPQHLYPGPVIFCFCK